MVLAHDADRALRSAFDFGDLPLRLTLDTNALRAVRNFCNEFPRAFFEVGDHALHCLVKLYLTLTLMLRGFFIERRKFLSDRAPLFFQRKSQRLRVFGFALDASQILR